MKPADPGQSPRIWEWTPTTGSGTSEAPPPARTPAAYNARRTRPAHAAHAPPSRRSHAGSRALSLCDRYRDNVTTRKRYTDAERTAAIDAYIANGAAYVESEFDVKAATVRQWAKRAGIPLGRERHLERAAQYEASGEEWALRRVRLANQIGEQAEHALAHVEASLRSQGGLVNARLAAQVLASLVANAQLLSGSATSRTENVETLRSEGEAILAGLEDQMRGATR